VGGVPGVEVSSVRGIGLYSLHFTCYTYSC